MRIELEAAPRWTPAYLIAANCTTPRKQGGSTATPYARWRGQDTGAESWAGNGLCGSFGDKA
ncbi:MULTISPECIES: hypothetical protein [unclassified Mesorhizobium]|uniref:hypothetical protein n=1 Tax=unclassified Mesorhizobium TaxID=325217 RepID=UPI00112863ED|nr:MULTISPECIES: hypothetical protein [unclassified Mesorhizobium]MBZ9974310.1 hypothetical protein [Mesorhizobium sp. BR-1-1-10]TPK10200.1 hypothetical protein FJ543_21955 [Mesorhizobium sp. B2-5-7]